MRMLRRGMALAAVLVMTLLAGGCGTITNSAIGTWVAEQGAVKLEFTGEGIVTGTNGCDRVTGAWAQDGDTVTLYSLSTHPAGCAAEDVWLVAPATATVSSGVMTLYNSDHEQLGQLTRQ